MKTNENINKNKLRFMAIKTGESVVIYFLDITETVANKKVE